MKQLAKLLLARTPYRIVRDGGANRFESTDACLRAMRARGYTPLVVIDGGAHIGSFSVAAQKIFPHATFHLVEPQPACRQALQTLSAAKGFVIHECALADREGMIGLTPTEKRSTGARIELDDRNSLPVVASTLDTLFGSISGDDRPLLKLDLQGYELIALRGGTKFLRSVEVILTEVSFYTESYDPLVGSVVSFLNDNDFQLYEITSLSGRLRDNRLRQGDCIFVRAGSSLLEDTRWA